MESGVRRHVVIVGAGVAGLEAALALQHLAPDHVSVELIAPEREFVYRPLAVAEPFHAGEVRRFSLATIARGAGAELQYASVVGVDPEQKEVILGGNGAAPYDVLVLTPGARPTEAIRGLSPSAARRTTARSPRCSSARRSAKSSVSCSRFRPLLPGRFRFTSSRC